jgi:UDPglucose 6-dehydrogenase
MMVFPDEERAAPMHVTVMGTGYVGLVTGAGLADLGLTVSCTDVNDEKIRSLQDGQIPIYEPGLEEIIRRNRERGRLAFSTRLPEAIRNCLVVFVAVGTEAGPDGLPDLRQVWAAVDMIAESADGYKIVVIKSTVPVGTARRLADRLRQRPPGAPQFDVVSNPEFLREGSAVEDFFHPNRIVIGTVSDRAAAVMKDIYRPLYLIQTPFVFTTPESAELIKYAANSYLALKISFINELANLCDAIGPSADVHVLAHALGLDPRIGSKFLHPGPGFGGSCLPKDSRALVRIAAAYGCPLRTVGAAVEVNERQFERVIEKLRQGLGSLPAKTVAVLGLAFKPNTDDVRESRAVRICEVLRREGCLLQVFDPAAMASARRLLGEDGMGYCSEAYEAVKDADATVFCTEWNEFRNLDLQRLKQHMRGDVLVDAKNILDPAAAKRWGFRYFGMGRSA